MIATQRLKLRPWCSKDLEPFAELNADEQVCRYLPKRLSRVESDAMAKRIDEHFSRHGFGFWALQSAEATFLGFVGLQRVRFSAHFTPAIEIAWRLHPRFWGRGYATEAALAALDFGFAVLKAIKSCRLRYLLITARSR